METVTRKWNPWNPVDPKTGKPAESEAARLRAQAADRAQAIALLGLAPEAESTAERYAATSGELWQILREERGIVGVHE